jgi:CII-binding regulator of phage lambda lysogenization HflD
MVGHSQSHLGLLFDIFWWWIKMLASLTPEQEQEKKQLELEIATIEKQLEEKTALIKTVKEEITALHARKKRYQIEGCGHRRLGYSRMLRW